ncbi:hypothetical protein K438DRAFT_1747417 [Mycena galopus ATCC 62051]|nr:hypothetical protein K438DRAFT_1747417 [Mycena galopus ATCC 62051]
MKAYRQCIHPRRLPVFQPEPIELSLKDIEKIDSIDIPRDPQGKILSSLKISCSGWVGKVLAPNQKYFGPWESQDIYNLIKLPPSRNCQSPRTGPKMRIGGGPIRFVTIRDVTVTRRVKLAPPQLLDAPLHCKSAHASCQLTRKSIKTLRPPLGAAYAPWVLELKNHHPKSPKSVPSCSWIQAAKTWQAIKKISHQPLRHPYLHQNFPVPSKDWKHEYQKLQRRFRHSTVRQKKLEEQLISIKLKDANSQRAAARSSARVKELSKIIENFAAENKKSAASTATMETLRKQVKSLKQRVLRSIQSLSRHVERAKKKWGVHSITKRGVYTAQARSLARVMVDSGCARGKVGPLMQRIAVVLYMKRQQTQPQIKSVIKA